MPNDFTPGEGGGWTNIGQIHNLPADEMSLHALSPGCACAPTVKQEDQVLTYIHNSYDARELNEKAGVLKSIPIARG